MSVPECHRWELWDRGMMVWEELFPWMLQAGDALEGGPLVRWECPCPHLLLVCRGTQESREILAGM